MGKGTLYGPMEWSILVLLLITQLLVLECINGKMVAGIKALYWMVNDMEKENISAQKITPNIMVNGNKV